MISIISCIRNDLCATSCCTRRILLHLIWSQRKGGHLLRDVYLFLVLTHFNQALLPEGFFFLRVLSLELSLLGTSASQCKQHSYGNGMGMAFGSVMRERTGQGLGNALRLLLSNTLLVSRDWELSISDITPPDSVHQLHSINQGF